MALRILTLTLAGFLIWRPATPNTLAAQPEAASAPQPPVASQPAYKSSASKPKPGSKRSRQAADDAAADALFTGPIQRFVITFTPAEIQKLRDNPRSPVQATVTVGTQRF
jgi:hypothetical protein